MITDLRFRLPVALLLCLLLHTTLLAEVRVAGVMPDIMLLVAVAAGLVAGPSYGAVAGFASGLLSDLLLPTPLGLSALVFTLIGYAVGLAKAGLLRESPAFPVAVAFVASSAGVGLFALAGSMIGATGLMNARLATVMLVVGIANGLLVLPVLRLVRWSLAGRPPERAYAE
ncbi:MAG TPA: rod shape-determining protein MreD [Acidimicrobiales bacterium]|jgi:rod shape-determining protein MreD|nr:rod shape-determining protein MreD [Acidimicrobiales bacterium]